MAYLSLEEIRATCHELSIIGLTLADAHSLALIVGSDGTISFTPLVSRVVCEAPHPHPLHKMIASACSSYHERTGGNCKPFLLLLDEVLRSAASLARDIDDSGARQTLLAELSSFETLPDLFRKIRDSIGTVSSVADDPVAFGQHLADVVRGRSEALSGIVCEFVRRSVPDWSALRKALEYYVRHFEDVCSRDLSAAKGSTVLKGFLLRADVPPSAHCFVVVRDVSVKAGGDITWVGDVVQLSRVWTKIEASLNELSGRGVSLILTPSNAPSRLHSLCSRLGISLADRLSSGDLQNVLFFTGVVSLDTLNDPIQSECISRIDSTRSVVLGGCQFLHLETSRVTTPFVPCHVVLRAPSLAVWKERFAEFVDCLKVLLQWLHPSESQGLNGVSFPLGLWESELKRALLQQQSPKHLCRLLAKGCRGTDPTVVPAASAETVLLQVLQLFRQLLRIDGVLGSKGRNSLSDT